MKKVLVLGGTRFFGKRLVHKLIDKGYDVSIATRGLTEDSFGDQVNRFVIDRRNPETLTSLSNHNWDLVYDNICYTPNEAKEIIKLLTNHVKKYIFTSSLAVYDTGLNHVESDFDPFIYPVEYNKDNEYSYAEGKRQCEAVLFQEANFPVFAARFPIVLGPDDYTKRLLFHVDKISNNEEMIISDLNKEMTFIDSDETAEFLLWLGENESIKSGPFNACSNGSIPFKEIVNLCEKETGIKAIISSSGPIQHQSPFDAYSNQSLSNEKAKKEGFQFLEVHDWMKRLIHHYCSR
ncbi:NAD-dependent epimerase/dehydratase family protein [Bacillus sp. AFS041924]|uniref:NAD-dependent epimerase/dehydratase family protein n=1 Tax=Bacillus sp. AFS041924 TaxID=2033503 RepID=UPI000BFD95E5|nr:NAD-dependent epimerase/dehydratase family protein [Bacillus sp. AFS041924]PGS47230.1 epimerase [Bacillus sp. AFS041924]